jgi:formate hydrogenlyase subunit 4
MSAPVKMTVTMTVASLLQLLFVLLLAPVFSSFIKRVHGRLQGRKGPSLLQAHFDLAKLFKKDRVYSIRSSAITRAAPVIGLAAVGAASMLVPIASAEALFHFAGDFILFVYLFGLSRFMTALMGLDAGSTFGGMGASRETTLSALAEPTMILAFIVVSASLGSMDLSVASARLIAEPQALLRPSFVLNAISFFIVILAENGRVPIDNPATHLELTMIHEGMALELSGPDLALHQWAHSGRLLVLTIAALNIFFPFGLATGLEPAALALGAAALVAKLAGAGIAIAYIETAHAKLRFFRAPDLLTLAFVLSLISLASLFMTGIKAGLMSGQAHAG